MSRRDRQNRHLKKGRAHDPHFKFSPETVIAALRRTKGMIAVAARTLRCHRGTIYDYIERFPAVKEALAFERELTIDDAELALYKRVNAGEAWAVCFLLKTLGKNRGYVERQEIGGAGGGPVSQVILYLPRNGREVNVPSERVTVSDLTLDALTAAETPPVAMPTEPPRHRAMPDPPIRR